MYPPTALRINPWCIAALSIVFLLLFSPSAAERLPIKKYTAADGLPRDNINRVVRDSHGFLWFCTSEGLSLFNGYTFTNYSMDKGLPHHFVADLLETRDGKYWLATGKGICYFNPVGLAGAQGNIGDRMFAPSLQSEHGEQLYSTDLLEDRNGKIWCGTTNGLYTIEEGVDTSFLRFVALNPGPKAFDAIIVNVLLEDRHGGLWIGTEQGLYRRWPNGRLVHYTRRDGLPVEGVKALFEDRDGHLWSGTPEGICRIADNPDSARSPIERVYSIGHGPLENWINDIFQSVDGRMWIGTQGGLFEFHPVTGTTQKFTTHHGLADARITAFAEDSHGNLWMGSESGGAMKLARNGFVSYGVEDGLHNDRINSIFENRNGDLCVVSSQTKEMHVSRFNGREFTLTRVNIPSHITDLGWGWYQTLLQDRTGEWWVPTGQGLCRFPSLPQVEQLSSFRTKAIYTIADGLPSNNIFRLYEDSKGDIWIAMSDHLRTLSRWKRSTGKMRTYSEADGLPSSNGPSAFCEDRSGNLWIGYYMGGLARYRDEQFTLLTEAYNVPAGTIRGLFLDDLHRLWIASSQGGLGRIDDPSAARPHIINYTKANGLSSNDVRCVTQDRLGRIYIGTGRGVDMLDPATGRITHYTKADGLASSEINVAYCDRDGALWFGTLQGLSRLLPAPDRRKEAAPILITRLHIAGTEYRISAIGQTETAEIQLAPEQNHLQIDFVGLAFAPGEALRYVYKLEGADDGWNTPTYHRVVNYANLSPGSYRFVVQALTTNDVASLKPATVTFTISPPIWQKWWFISLSVMFLGAVLYALYRYRVMRLLEMEHLRLRIASDLHDELATNLSSIATLSQIIREEEAETTAGLLDRTTMLSRINILSRDSVDAIRDIIWALDPKTETLHGVLMRAHDFALPLCRAKHVQFDFEVPSAEKLPLGNLTPDQRKHLWLIMKEAIHNALKHSQCTCLSFRVVVPGSRILEVRIRDNGLGFDPLCASKGKGLSTMRMRAQKLNGTLEIVTREATGSEIIFWANLTK